ncbi:MAG TPA: oxidoreductase, partial [Mycobacteriales bacterium]|nr:oxidoreductase [Mycobacteriales bacterium]
WGTAPRQALARLHVLAAGGDDADPELLGRPRGGAAVAQRLDVLVEALGAPTTAPAVVVAAVVHGELLALELFGPDTGVVARAAGRLVLLERGVDPKGVTAPDVGHLAGGYAEAAAAYRAGDVGTWVRHCCAALVTGSEEGLVACDVVKGRPVQK